MEQRPYIGILCFTSASRDSYDIVGNELDKKKIPINNMAEEVQYWLIVIVIQLMMQLQLLVNNLESFLLLNFRLYIFGMWCNVHPPVTVGWANPCTLFALVLLHGSLS